MNRHAHGDGGTSRIWSWFTLEARNTIQPPINADEHR
jgi:hypothetical protein